MEREGRSSYVVSVPRVGGSWACVVVVERGRASRDTNTLWCRRRIRCILPAALLYGQARHLKCAVCSREQVNKCT